jgi:hypothetical protein
LATLLVPVPGHVPAVEKYGGLGTLKVNTFHNVLQATLAIYSYDN